MRARLHLATIVVVATTAAAVTAAGALSADAAAVPAKAAAVQARVVSNLAYAPAQPAGSVGHLLDLYLPGGTTPRPLVIWTSGSAWMSDNGKKGASSIAATFNAAGYAVAGVSVRSSSQAKFPAQIYDIKAAIRWLRAQAARYQLDINRFAIMGDSSGGWVSAMATLTGGVSPLEGGIGTTGLSSSVQAGVDFFGPTDFLQLNAQRVPGGVDHDRPNSPESLLMGCAIRTCPSLVAQANPIGYVDRDDPPMLLVHGRADNVVPHGQSVLLYNALIAACRNARFISVQGANHGLSEVMASSRFGTQRVYTNTGCRPTTAVGSPNPTWEIVIDFLNSALGVGSSGSAGSASPGPSGGASPTPTPGGTPTCTAVATVRTEWSEGYVIQPVLITNTGSSAITSWTVTFTLPADHIITGWWNGVLTARGQTVTVQNDTFNGDIASGSSVTSVGFLVSRPDGTTAVPSGYTCTSR